MVLPILWRYLLWKSHLKQFRTMKWVILISCVFLISFTGSKGLSRRYRDVGHQDTINHFSNLSPVNLGIITFILYSQIGQKATYEELRHLTEDIVELAKKCTADGQSDPACNKPLHTVFLDELCHEQVFAEKHGFTECCAKADPERNECVLSHKNATSGHIAFLEKQSTEEQCQAYQDDSHQVLGHFLSEVSTKAPFSLPTTILHAGYEYDSILKTCCQEADKDACFQEKIQPVRNSLLTFIGHQKTTCFILKKFGKRAMKDLKVVQLSQKFPSAEFPVISKLAEDSVHTLQECCKGDTLECLLERDHSNRFICTHQDAISSKVKSCCEKDVLEQGDCIKKAERDDKPGDLTESIKDEFVTNKDVCQHYSHNKTHFITKFLYEYGRGRLDLSYRIILKFARGYGNQVEKCCQHEPAVECLGKWEERANEYIAEAKEVINSHCDTYGKIGNYLFQNELLTRFTKKAPQLSFEELQEVTKTFVDLTFKCCGLEEAKRLPCSENHGALVLTIFCQKNEEHQINKEISKCCNDSYASLWDCLTKLDIDPDFVPVPFSPEVFTFSTDSCHINTKDMESKHQKLLFNLIKYKPSITKEQLAVTTADFTTLLTKCCAAENHDECFAAEGPQLVEKIKADLAEN